MKFHMNDEVVVVRGSDAGLKGIIVDIDETKNRVRVSNANMIVKHMKPKAGKAGGRVSYEGYIHASNVMHVNASGKATRVKSGMDGKKKVRMTVKGNAQVTKGKLVKAPKKGTEKATESQE